VTHAIQMIPIDAIDAEALTRDRQWLDDEAMLELRLSIVSHGLRQPVEVFELAEPEGGVAYGLISGFRRLAAFRELHGMSLDKARYAAIPAFVRRPRDVAEAVVAMVEENAIRAELSPFEQGRIAVVAQSAGLFATIEEAVERIYPAASSQKRARLRALARLAAELCDELTAPEKLSQTQALRLAAAYRAGFGPVIRVALMEASARDPESQWQILLPILQEAELSHAPLEEPRMPGRRGGRPRRVLRLPAGLTIRREMARDGWLLRFTGPEATGGLVDRVMEEIERLFAPGEPWPSGAR
jgi:ParB family transcriptional regulator, chromosome partitioning protein